MHLVPSAAMHSSMSSYRMMSIRLAPLLVAGLLSTGPVPLGAQVPSSPEARDASPAEDTTGTDAPGALPVSVDRIREALLRTPAVPAIRGLNERPTFSSGVEERLTLEDFFRPEDFKVGPVPPGGLYAHEMQRVVSNPVSDPLAQPYAAFNGAQLATIAIENLIFRYLGQRLTQAFASDGAAQAAAEAEVARAIAEYCAAQPGNGRHIEICRSRTAPR